MHVLVEASCLAWVEVDLEQEAVIFIRLHALPDNVDVRRDADVVTADPEEASELDDLSRSRARAIASRPLPDRFRVMR
jgi:hypothetical protein